MLSLIEVQYGWHAGCDAPGWSLTGTTLVSRYWLSLGVQAHSYTWLKSMKDALLGGLTPAFALPKRCKTSFLNGMSGFRPCSLFRSQIQTNWVYCRSHVLYDCPPAFFRRAKVKERHNLFKRLAEEMERGIRLHKPSSLALIYIPYTHAVSSNSGVIKSPTHR